MTIAFLGLGAMGQHMATNLLKSGQPVHVWNRGQEPVAALVRQGAIAAATPAACGLADIVFSMLADDAVTRAVLIDGGVLDAMAPGSIHVNMATVSVAFAREMAALHLARGIGYVAAPVLGRVDVAAAGKLNILAGGSDELVERVQPLLDLLGQKTWRFGAAAEQANAVKLSCNLTLACAIEAMGEGAALAGAHGIAPASFIELITSTLFAGSPIKRIGHGRFIRNVLIALGNSGDQTLLPLVEARLDANDPLVRGAAIWALRRLDPQRAEHAALAYASKESDSSVRSEWTVDIS